jgi:FkbM family methyltransferase
VNNATERVAEPFSVQTRDRDGMGQALENSLKWRDFVRRNGYPNYEDILRIAYCRFLQPGDVVFDVGAHEGLHAENFLRICGPHGRVVCFEPIPKCAQTLRERFSAIPTFSLCECALSNRVGQAEFTYAQNYPQESGLRERIFNGPEPNITLIQVKTSTVDAEVERLGLIRLDFIKIDIEGGEIDCLSGGLQTLDVFRPIISVEYGGTAYGVYGHKAESLFDLLEPKRYVLADLWGNLINERDEWLAIVNNAYWDYFAVPQEKAAGWSALVCAS